MPAQPHLELVTSPDSGLGEAISPELALVDPDLAERARALLELPRPTSAAPIRTIAETTGAAMRPTSEIGPPPDSEPLVTGETEPALKPPSPVALRAVVPRAAPVLPETSVTPTGTVDASRPIVVRESLRSAAVPVPPESPVASSVAAPIPQAAVSLPALPARRGWLRFLRGLAILVGCFAAGLVGGLFVWDVWGPERPSILAEQPSQSVADPAATTEPPAAVSTPAPAETRTSRAAGGRSGQAGEQASRKPPAPGPIATPVFVWVAVPKADRYEVIFERGGKAVYRATTTRTRLELPRSWRFQGNRYRLEPGRYHWTVWPLVRGKRAERPLVSSDYVR